MITTTAWLSGNLQLIAKQMSYATIEYDSDNYEWISINPFPLPAKVKQNFSRLLITLPGLQTPITEKPIAFYLNTGLKHSSGRSLEHVFNKRTYHECENLSHLGYAWFCLILNRWKPSTDVVSGDNLLTVINTIFHQLNEL